MSHTRHLVRGLALLAAPLAGCATHEQSGALAGGLLGAGTGALIGKANGNAGAGAIIGAAAGTIGGAMVGAGQDTVDRRNAARVAAATAPGPMTASDVAFMVQSGVAEQTIVTQINSTRSVFNLTPADVVNLKNQGVSDRLVQVMLESNRRPMAQAQPVIVSPPPPAMVYGAPPPVIVVERPPPPPRLGFTYVHHGRR